MRKKTGHVIILALLAVIFPGGCAPDFQPQSLVDKFRILAVKVDPPAGPPGQDVVITPLVSESQYNRQAIVLWMTCIPLPGQTATQCLEAGEAVKIGFEETLTISLPELAPEENEKSIDVILLACAGIPTIPDFEKGDYDFCESPESDIAIRTVTVTREDPNRGPAIESLSLESPEIGTLEPEEGAVTIIDCSGGCSDITVTLTLARGSVETYDVVRFGETETHRENPFISWFATAGDFSSSRTYESNYSGLEVMRDELFYDIEWTPPGESGEVLFYFIAYDGRGGVDFRVREALVLTEGG